MIKNIFLLMFLFSSWQSKAQKTDDEYAPPQYKDALCKSHFLRVSLEGERNETNVRLFLFRQIANLRGENVGLHLRYVHESPGGFHYSFNQTFRGIEVYQTEVKVNIDRKNGIRSLFDNSENTSGWSIDVSQSVNNPVIIIHPRTLLPVLAERYIEDHSTEVIMANGEIIFQRDMNSYFAPPDSLVSGKIFNPDPLTTAGQVYNVNSIYKDNNDSNAVWLDAQLQTVQFRANFTGTEFTLESPFIRVRDVDGPSIPPVTSSIPEFYFNRSQSGFEDVNAFYHISTVQQHVQSLGFDCGDQLVDIDPHGLSADNSIFYPGHIPKRIVFGIGGVDDAEDADVCVHEYAHFLSDNAAPNSNFGSQRAALDEAFGDYLAASYSKSINSFNGQWVYNWDGHNEFWNGRTVNTTRIYPTNLVTSIYRNGEMWSTALMNIHDEIGRLATDSLILQTHYSYAQDISMADAAELLIDADTLLTNGKYYCSIYKHLLAQGFVSVNSNNLCGINGLVDGAEDATTFVSNHYSFQIFNRSGEELDIELFTLNGQTIARYDHTHSGFQYQNTSLPAGIYLVSVRTNNAQKTFKWVKVN